jgi:hypothetical protein
MGHKYAIGQDVYYYPPINTALRPARTRSSAGCRSSSRGRLFAAEKFERTADENDLSPAD